MGEPKNDMRPSPLNPQSNETLQLVWICRIIHFMYSAAETLHTHAGFIRMHVHISCGVSNVYVSGHMVHESYRRESLSPVVQVVDMSRCYQTIWKHVAVLSTLALPKPPIQVLYTHPPALCVLISFSAPLSLTWTQHSSARCRAWSLNHLRLVISFMQAVYLLMQKSSPLYSEGTSLENALLLVVYFQTRHRKDLLYSLIDPCSWVETILRERNVVLINSNRPAFFALWS